MSMVATMICLERMGYDMFYPWIRFGKETTHSDEFLSTAGDICEALQPMAVECLIKEILEMWGRQGRLFVIGIGGSAANASHAVNDFRKLCNIEAYCPSDNIAEFSARTNDEGWDTAFSGWLKVSKLNDKDALLILSVGGGSKKENVSWPIIRAVDLALNRGARVLGIVGKADGHVAEHGHVVIVIPSSKKWLTPMAESFQSLILHCVVSHPDLQMNKTKW